MQLLSLFTSLALVSAVVSSPAADLNVNVARADQHGNGHVTSITTGLQDLLLACSEARNNVAAMLIVI
jgi:hypothetical protein